MRKYILNIKQDYISSVVIICGKLYLKNCCISNAVFLVREQF